MHGQRQLSDPELVQLAASHCGMSAARFAAYTSIDFVVDPDDEIHLLEWSYENRVKFLLMAATTYGRPN
jgi:hypothetical protein